MKRVALLMVFVGLVLTAVVKKMRFSQMTGLEWPNPGMRVFHATFIPDSTFQTIGRRALSATPRAPSPRKEGQFSAARRLAPAKTKRSGRMGLTLSQNQVAPLTIHA